MNGYQKITRLLVVSVAFVTLLAYLPSLQNGFVTWDDNNYVYRNPDIRSLNSHFFKWAFFGFHVSNWHPLTWITHAADFALWGLIPLGHHLTNIFFHMMNTMLVMLLVLSLFAAEKECAGRETMRRWPFSPRGSLMAAGTTALLFGLHPIHVESVAWVSERKDVLYAFFYLLSLLTYIRYVREKPLDSGDSLFSVSANRYYILTLVLFVLSLMSKPMAVTLPVVLLILDWYPFRRLERGKPALLMVEKLPFILLSLGSSIITIQAQHAGGSITSFSTIPLLSRMLVGVKALVDYAAKIIVPVHLSPFYPYPHPNQMPLLSLGYGLPLLLVFGITALCVVYSRKYKAGLALWAYYIVTLLPVLGIVQVGEQSMADRYMYLPCLGLLLPIAMGGAWVLDNRSAKGGSVVLKVIYLVALLIVSLSYLTIRQIRIWENGETLWNRVTEIYPKVPTAYNNRGVYYRDNEQYEKALVDFTKALSLSPDDFLFYTNRALVYVRLGRFEEALNDANEAIRLSPATWKTYYTRAKVYSSYAQYPQAAKDYTEAIKLNPGLSEPYNNRGNIDVRLGLLDQAVDDYTHAINLAPFPVAAYYQNRGIAYKVMGESEKALTDFKTAEALRDIRSQDPKSDVR